MEKFFRAEAVILSTTDFGDANRVVTFYTREYGKIEANAYGCRRAKNPLSGAMQMFNHVKVDIIRGATVYRVHEADIIDVYKTTENLNRLAYATVYFEIVNKISQVGQPDENVFRLLLNSLKAFETRNPRITALTAAFQFMQSTGFQLNYERCANCGDVINGDVVLSLVEGGAICQHCQGFTNDEIKYSESTRRLILSLLKFDWKDETKLKLKLNELEEAERFFLKYVQSVIEAPLQSLKFLNQIKSLSPP